MVYLAKIGKVKIVCSKELTPIPSSVKVIKDSANRYFLSFVVEVWLEVLPKTDNSVSLCYCGFKGGKLDLLIREWECPTLWG